MEKILSFLLEHIELCVACFVALITLLLQLIKKKPVKVVDSVEESILKVLPDFINQAEKAFPESGKGAEKGQFVLGCVWKYLHDLYGFQDFDIYTDFIKSAVEYILSTPQKKGE